ncbi:chitinase-like protein 1 [Quercus suber]|uniref:Chitinase-like protein 1 n=1 Tax=Quercus suber TaxID=58331 RepID=A0AAW0LBJ6_QUESU
MKISRKTEILTGGFGANMGRKSCDFLGSKKGLVHVGSAKAIALVFSRSNDKRVVVPEALCKGLNRVTGGKSTSQPNRGDGQTKADGGDDGVGNRVPSDTPSVPGSDCVGGNTFSEANHSLGFVPEASVATSQTTLLLQAAENPVGWDKAENSNQNQQKTDNSRAPQRKINFGGSQTLRSEERASAPKVGLLESLSPRTQEATSPLRAKLERKCKPETHPTVLGPSNCSQTRKKVNLKKVARKKAQDDGQAHDAEMFTPVVEVGSKRPEVSEDLKVDLLNQPEYIEQNATLAFQVAIWRWMTPTKKHQPSAHEVFIGYWKPTKNDTVVKQLYGFGATMNVLYGDLVCGRGDNESMNNIISHYLYYLDLMGVGREEAGPREVLSCGEQVSLNPSSFSSP